MRPILLMAVAVFASAEAPPPATIDRYEQLVAAQRFKEAGTLVDQLIRERVPADGKPRPDPVLSAMIGSLYLRANHANQAGGFLKQATLADLPPALRAPTALDQGEALELRGERAEALIAYRAAAAASHNDGQRRKAAIGIARQVMLVTPDAAQPELLPIANGPPEAERWEARYLLAVSSSLKGDLVSAAKWADGAWADAANAPLRAIAPLRVETLRAALAAAAHDVAVERAMLTVSNGLGLSANRSLAAQLPICGDAGLRPSDFVIFGFASGPLGTRDLMPISASRPEVILPFYDRLAGTVPIKESNGQTGIGTVFTVRCRSVVNSDFVAKPAAGDPLLAWAAENGLYPASVLAWGDDASSGAIHDWVDTLAARFGKDNPLLIIPRWQLLMQLRGRAQAGETIMPGQLAELRNQIAEGIRRFGGPEWVANSIEMQTELERMTLAAADGTDVSGEFQGLLQKQLLAAPFDVARPGLLSMLSEVHGDWPPQASQAVLDLNAREPRSQTVREHQAWQLTVARALRNSGKDAQARQAVIAAGIPRDACLAMDRDTTLLEQHFSDKDYPEPLEAGEQEGAVLFEYGLTADGKVTNPRVVYSLPSGLFDEASVKGLETLRYLPVTSGAKPASCKGLYQPIVWKLEEDGPDLSVPLMPPTESAGPTT